MSSGPQPKIPDTYEEYLAMDPESGRTAEQELDHLRADLPLYRSFLRKSLHGSADAVVYRRWIMETEHRIAQLERDSALA